MQETMPLAKSRYTFTHFVAILLCSASVLGLAGQSAKPTTAAFTDSASATATVSSDRWIVTTMSFEKVSFMGGDFTWTPVGGYTSYQVQWNGNPTFDAKQGTTTTVTGSKWTPSGSMSAEGNSSYFRIRAVGAPNNTWSATYEFPTVMRLL